MLKVIFQLFEDGAEIKKNFSAFYQDFELYSLIHKDRDKRGRDMVKQEKVKSEGINGVNISI
ncbi:hypothetical protein wTpre_1104 [Wolbachia endosymbiont of Trichogramma pretiosum]|nr:hypothetical protein wTpre_1104 [Wolbachia endosymbiont of Trichogramma pretiosum]